MNIQAVKENLKKKGYAVTVCRTKQEAAEYILRAVKGKTVGFGGSQTLTELDLRHTLTAANTVLVPDFPGEGETFEGTAIRAMDTQLYFLSANAVSEAGEIINIDGIGNRLAGSLFGHEKVYYVIGENKIGGTLKEAISRARNVAGPKNALRLFCKTPCAMAVAAQLEEKFRKKYGIEGDIDELKWEQFIHELDVSELNTHCYDCSSPDRICGSLLVHLMKPGSMEAEVVIIREPMGF